MKDRLELLRAHADKRPNSFPPPMTEGSPAGRRVLVPFKKLFGSLLLASLIGINPVDTSFRPDPNVSLDCSSGDPKIVNNYADAINRGDLTLVAEFPGEEDIISVYPKDARELRELDQRTSALYFEYLQGLLDAHIRESNYPPGVQPGEIVDPVRAALEERLRISQQAVEESNNPNSLELKPVDILPIPVVITIYRGNLEESFGSRPIVSKKFLDPNKCKD